MLNIFKEFFKSFRDIFQRKHKPPLNTSKPAPATTEFPEPIQVPVKDTPVSSPSTQSLSIAEKVIKAADEFAFEKDPLLQAKFHSKRKYDKSVLVFHFSWTRDLNSLSNYFSKTIKGSANSTWGVGKDGTVHRYLPSYQNPSWTQGIRSKYKHAGFITHEGKVLRGRINDLACAFEIANRNYEPYTDEQYFACAVRTMWMLRSGLFPNFRIWLCTGHSHLVPIIKDDPGKHWDWEKFFVKFCGVKQEFYNTYLSYLQETAYSTVRDESRTALKWSLIKEGMDKITADLVGKGPETGF